MTNYDGKSAFLSNQADRRFHAAIAIMPTMVQIFYSKDKEIPWLDAVASHSTLIADALLAKLAETEPKCEHRYARFSETFPKDSPIVVGEHCIRCGEVLK